MSRCIDIAIQYLKEAALAKEFDVLLVFMFDRLGRIENETPFVLQWLLFTRVEIGKGYKVHIELNMTYRQFLEDWCSGTVIEAIAG